MRDFLNTRFADPTVDFDKRDDELETYPEKWLYLMRNTLKLEEVPEDFRSERCFVEFQLSCGFELSDL